MKQYHRYHLYEDVYDEKKDDEEIKIEDDIANIIKNMPQNIYTTINIPHKELEYEENKERMKLDEIMIIKKPIEYETYKGSLIKNEYNISEYCTTEDNFKNYSKLDKYSKYVSRKKDIYRNTPIYNIIISYVDLLYVDHNRIPEADFWIMLSNSINYLKFENIKKLNNITRKINPRPKINGIYFIENDLILKINNYLLIHESDLHFFYNLKFPCKHSDYDNYIKNLSNKDKHPTYDQNKESILNLKWIRGELNNTIKNTGMFLNKYKDEIYTYSLGTLYISGIGNRELSEEMYPHVIISDEYFLIYQSKLILYRKKDGQILDTYIHLEGSLYMDSPPVNKSVYLFKFISIDTFVLYCGDTGRYIFTIRNDKLHHRNSKNKYLIDKFSVNKTICFSYKNQIYLYDFIKDELQYTFEFKSEILVMTHNEKYVFCFGNDIIIIYRLGKCIMKLDYKKVVSNSILTTPENAENIRSAYIVKNELYILCKDLIIYRFRETKHHFVMAKQVENNEYTYIVNKDNVIDDSIVNDLEIDDSIVNDLEIDDLEIDDDFLANYE